ncbi:MAG: M23 family metallopeptidase [Gemmatimonadota bacterium]|nr:M23 family metallopeptidase [Gemmatimonadota bacterium]
MKTGKHARWKLVMVTLGVATTASCYQEPPDVGTLDAVYAEPAEHVRISVLRDGQTLGQLLEGSVSYNERASLLLALREHANPRRMRAGTEVTLRFRRGDESLRGVDVATSRDETVRLSLVEGAWSSELVRTPIYVDTLTAAGEINTSLWVAVVGNPVLNSMSPGDANRLIDQLDKVFQWQIDFSRQIRVGDTYRFAFEREVRPDGSMRAGRLLAAEMVTANTAYHALWFDPNEDGDGSYYNLEGESVRGEFLLKPLTYRRISSTFTNSRFHPLLKTWRAHRGIDYAADRGTDIMATSDGVVIYRGAKGTFGNTVEIRHGNGFITRYAHMSRFQAGVNVGTRVRQSDIIGHVGMTGLAGGPHLHYEILSDGRQIDPLSVDLPAGDPVPSENRFRWRFEMTAHVALLEAIPGAGPVRMLADDQDRDQPEDHPGGAQ